MFPSSVSIQNGITGSTGAVAGGNDGLQQTTGKNGDAGAFGAILQQQIGTDGTQATGQVGEGGSWLQSLMAGNASDGTDPLAALFAELQISQPNDPTNPNDPLSGQSDLQALLASINTMAPMQLQTDATTKIGTSKSVDPNKLLLDSAKQLLKGLEQGSPIIQQMIAGDDELKQMLAKLQQATNNQLQTQAKPLQELMQAMNSTGVGGSGEIPVEELKQSLRNLIKKLENSDSSGITDSARKGFLQAAQPLLHIIDVTKPSEVLEQQAKINDQQNGKLGDQKIPMAYTLLSQNAQSAALSGRQDADATKSGTINAPLNNGSDKSVMMPLYHPLMHLQPPAQALQLTQVPAQPMNSQQFVSDMGSWIMKNMQVIKSNGMHEAKFKLFPDQLGQVDVSVKFQNGQIVATFVADTAQGKDLIENQLTQLRGALQQQGINVEKLEVSQQNLSHDGFNKEQRHSHSGSNHQGRKARHDLNEKDVIDGPIPTDRGMTAGQLQLNHMNWMRRASYGAAVNVQA